MLFNDPKLIFIHIPKTGGSSLSRMLKAGLRERDKRFDNHDTLQMYHDQGIDVSQYKIITTARNPWDRVLSFYCHHYDDKDNSFIMPRTFPTFGEGGRTYISFPEYYSTISSRHRYMEEFPDWLSVDGVIPDNLTIFDFENLERDITEFFEVFGLPKLRIPHARLNRRLPKELRDYFKYDPVYLRKINLKYRNEIEYFGYEAPVLKYIPTKREPKLP